MASYGPEDLEGISLGPGEVVSEALERKLGLFSVVIISLSAMIGSGLFLLPSLAMLEMGGGESPAGGVWLAYLAASLVVLPGAISKSELSTAMPSSGGSYLYVERAFGPLVGTISGLGLWANFMLKSAFALIGFKAYLWVFEEILAPSWEEGWLSENVNLIALILLAIIVVINILGVKSIKRVQIPIVMFSTTYLFAICIWALMTSDLNWDAATSREAIGGGWSSVATTTAFVFVSYAGVTKIAAVGGEVKNPERNLPYGILLSLLISCALYVTVTLVMALTVDPAGYMSYDGSKAREDPVYVFADAVGGKTVANIAAFLAVLTMASMSLAGILASSRFPFAMSKDRLMPEFLEGIHEKYNTPHWAIIATGLSIAAALTLLDVKDVAKLASGFKIMIFMVINGCVIVLRTSSSSHGWYRPEWKTPWPLYPGIQLFGIFGGAGLLFLMGSKAVIGATASIVLGSIIYLGYGRSHSEPRITPWDSAVKKILDPRGAETRRRYAAFYESDLEGKGSLDLGEFVSAVLLLGYIDKGGANIPDDSIVVSRTKSSQRDQTVRDIFRSGDENEDGLIDIEEFLKMADEIEPQR
ncbi:MAG: amino acid transporter [Euryarchaeota archaeon]|nr:amino acid transporter [Euryarchaeota archaeon]